ncbi:trafficking regulator of GLUT4 1 isoform X1 [Erinaceus europaeus]|uniref:Trafficking regulator of GLUT4 1 isoform X1 n=1 Tax=Erinaceus europaeus TaxID=9365 RepID=A0ABM3YBI2_ERIEU|nr:trafficking regulator of GLUT4 1 isoform X1 [Erinaceus europaeus]
MANPVLPQFPPMQESGTAASPLELPEMQKLLTQVEVKDDKPLKLSKSLSGTLDMEHNGHGLPFKVASGGHQDAPLSRSLSRVSSRRASSIVSASDAQDREAPKDYLILAIASCFCPVWPLNLIPLIFSIMSRSSVQQGDIDGARRLGRLARLLSITFIIMGIVIIVVAVTVNLAGEAGCRERSKPACLALGMGDVGYLGEGGFWLFNQLACASSKSRSSLFCSSALKQTPFCLSD